MPVLWICKESEEDTYFNYEGEWAKNRDTFVESLNSRIKELKNPLIDYVGFIESVVPRLVESGDKSVLNCILICQNAYQQTILDRIISRPDNEMEIYSEVVEKSMSLLRNIEAHYEVNTDMSLMERFEDNEKGSCWWGRVLGGLGLGIGAHYASSMVVPPEGDILSVISLLVGVYCGFVIGDNIGSALAGQENQEFLRQEFEREFEPYKHKYVSRLMSLKTSILVEK